MWLWWGFTQKVQLVIIKYIFEVLISAGSAIYEYNLVPLLLLGFAFIFDIFIAIVTTWKDSIIPIFLKNGPFPAYFCIFLSFQRSAAWIQSLANIYIEHLLSTVLKRLIYRKRGREWPIFKEYGTYLQESNLEFHRRLKFRNCKIKNFCQRRRCAVFKQITELFDQKFVNFTSTYSLWSYFVCRSMLF